MISVIFSIKEMLIQFEQLDFFGDIVKPMYKAGGLNFFLFDPLDFTGGRMTNGLRSIGVVGTTR